jgi:hypothetical protein
MTKGMNWWVVRTTCVRLTAGAFLFVAGCGPTQEAREQRVESIAKTSIMLEDTSFAPDPNPDLANPERGIFYEAGSGAEPNGYTLAYHSLFLGLECNQNLVWAGRGSPSTSAVLNTWANTAVAERGNGRKVVFRPRYDTAGAGEGYTNGPCGKFEADSYARMQNHADAIGAMLADPEIKPIVAFIEMGYLGSWGEWNASGNLQGGGSCKTIKWPLGCTVPNCTCTANCVEACRTYSPVLLAASTGQDRITLANYVINAYRNRGVTRSVGLRRPEFFRNVEQTLAPPLGAIGFYNDCFMQSSSDGGTFSHLESDFTVYSPLYTLSYPGQPDTGVQSAKNYMQGKAPNGSQGGESCPNGSDTEDWQMQDVTGRLNADSFQYLHATWAPKFEARMRQRGMWDDIKRRLGYRYQATRVAAPDTPSPGSAVTVSIDIYNDGFGQIPYDRNAYIVLTGPGNYVIGASDPGLPGYVFVAGWSPQNQTARMWPKSMTSTFSWTFSAPSPGGNYQIGLYVPDKDCIGNAYCNGTIKASYAVKLATLRNGAPVADGNGVNQLGVSLAVGPEGPDLTALHHRIPITARPDLCLDTYQGQANWHTPVVLGPCYDSSARWTYNRSLKRITHDPSGLCLDIAGANPSPGATVQLFGCNGGMNQQWTYDRTTRTLTSGIGTVLDVQNANFQATTPVWSWPLNGGNAQQWWADQPFNFVPNPPSVCGHLYPGEGLMPWWGAWSCDGRFELFNGTQADGWFRHLQMIPYQNPPPGGPSGTSVTRWGTQWFNFPGVVVMQGDGNLVLYDSSSGLPMWASTSSYGHNGVSLSIPDNGNLVINDFNGTELWSSHSCCY